MNDLIPAPPADTGLQLMEPMANSPAPAAPKFRLQKLLYFLRKFWWIPLVTLTLGLSTAVYIIYHSPPVFVSYGRLMETQKLRLPVGADYSEDRDNFLGTQDSLLRSDPLRDMTLKRMQALGTDPIPNDANPPWVDIQTITSPRNSIYVVAATCVNPAFTQAYLDALMQQYLEYRKNVRSEVSGTTLASISEQVQRLERDMQGDQAAVDEFERSNNFAVLQEKIKVEASYLANLRTELSGYQLEVKLLAARELEADSGSLSATNFPGDLFPSLNRSGTVLSPSSERLDADKQIELLKQERDRLSKKLLPEHPKIVSLNKDIDRAQKLLDIYRDQNHEQIAAARQVLQIKIDSIQEFITDYEAKVSAASELIAKADSLKQKVVRNQAMFDQLTSLMENLKIGRDIDQENLTILQPASSATRSKAAAISMLEKFGFLGFVVGIGIIFLLALRDDRFHSLVEVTEKFGDNVVGQLPEMPRISKTEPLLLLKDNDERHMFAESYRNLRSALLYLAVDGKRPQVLLITSAVPNEGKSTVATNLARSMALGGSRVLLVDGDLRKGYIHERLNLSSKPGLSELLRKPDILDQYIQATDLPNFDFLSRGSITRNPGDLFLSPAFDQVLARFRERYDYVIFDSSPVFAADDTSTIAPKADGTLFVVRSRFSKAKMVKQALELLFQRQARVLGLVVNRADTNPRSYYSYKYAEYYAAAAEETDAVSQ